MNPLYKERLKLILKLTLGVCVVIYVFKSKMVDLKGMNNVLYDPTNIAVAFTFLLWTLLCCAYRWYLLVRVQGIRLSFFHLIELYMIGNFFNTLMPGSVGGDLIKAYYIAGREPERKTRAVFTVLLDRAIGLAVIVFYSAFTCLFYPQWIQGHPELKAVAVAIWAFTALCLVGGVLFFASNFWMPKFLTRFLDKIKHTLIGKMIDSMMLYRHHFFTILSSVFISFISIFALNIFYSLFGDRLGIQMPLSKYFFIVPLAVTTTAIPLLPGGIGVGQVAFFKLFQWMEVPRPELGGSLCTVIQIYTLLFSCFGAYFYIRYKQHPKSSVDTEAPTKPLAAARVRLET